METSAQEGQAMPKGPFDVHLMYFFNFAVGNNLIGPDWPTNAIMQCNSSKFMPHKKINKTGNTITVKKYPFKAIQKTVTSFAKTNRTYFLEA